MPNITQVVLELKYDPNSPNFQYISLLIYTPDFNIIFKIKVIFIPNLKTLFLLTAWRNIHTHSHIHTHTNTH